MKKVLLSLYAVVFFLCIAGAQETAQELRGGFGHGFFGPVLNITPRLQDELRSPQLLGSDLQINTFGMSGGGGGYALLPIRLLVGGSGFGYGVSDATERGQARVNMGGGMINLGYLAFQKPHVLGFPYFGIGGNGINLTIKNRTDNDTLNLDGAFILPDEEVNLNSGGMLFELGFALKILAFTLNENNQGGGFIVGIQAGSYMFAAVEDWHDEDSDDLVTSMSKPYAFAPYLRITIGGGGFGKKEKKRKNSNDEN